MNLHEDSQRSLDKRKDVGEKCLTAATGTGKFVEGIEDREMFASDAISDILTALYGPAGVYRHIEGGGVHYEPDVTAQDNGRLLLDRALDSWYGDAEDYDYDGEAEA